MQALTNKQTNEPANMFGFCSKNTLKECLFDATKRYRLPYTKRQTYISPAVMIIPIALHYFNRVSFTTNESTVLHHPKLEQQRR